MSNKSTETTFTEALTNLLNNGGKLSFTVDTEFSTRYDDDDEGDPTFYVPCGDEAVIEIEILQGNKMYITAEFDNTTLDYEVNLDEFYNSYHDEEFEDMVDGIYEEIVSDMEDEFDLPSFAADRLVAYFSNN